MRGGRLTVCWHAHALAGYTPDGLGRADDKVLAPVRCVNTVHDGLLTIGLEETLSAGVVVGGIDDAHGEVTVYRVSGQRYQRNEELKCTRMT